MKNINTLKWRINIWQHLLPMCHQTLQSYTSTRFHILYMRIWLSLCHPGQSTQPEIYMNIVLSTGSCGCNVHSRKWLMWKRSFISSAETEMTPPVMSLLSGDVIGHSMGMRNSSFCRGSFIYTRQYIYQNKSPNVYSDGYIQWLLTPCGLDGNGKSWIFYFWTHAFEAGFEPIGSVGFSIVTPVCSGWRTL